MSLLLFYLSANINTFLAVYILYIYIFTHIYASNKPRFLNRSRAQMDYSNNDTNEFQDAWYITIKMLTYACKNIRSLKDAAIATHYIIKYEQNRMEIVQVRMTDSHKRLQNEHIDKK